MPIHPDVIAQFDFMAKYPLPWTATNEDENHKTRDTYLVDATGATFAIIHYIGPDDADKAFADVIIDKVNSLSLSGLVIELRKINYLNNTGQMTNEEHQKQTNELVARHRS